MQATIDALAIVKSIESIFFTWMSWPEYSARTDLDSAESNVTKGVDRSAPVPTETPSFWPVMLRIPHDSFLKRRPRYASTASGTSPSALPVRIRLCWTSGKKRPTSVRFQESWP